MAKHNQRWKAKKKHAHDLPKIKTWESILIVMIAFSILLFIYFRFLMPEASFHSDAEEISITAEAVDAEEKVIPSGGEDDEGTESGTIESDSKEKRDETLSNEVEENDEEKTTETNNGEKNVEEDASEDKKSLEDTLGYDPNWSEWNEYDNSDEYDAESSTELIATFALEEEKDLKSYLEENDGFIEETLRLGEQDIIPDENGSYSDVYGQGFNYELIIVAPNGIQSGKYTYPLPQEVFVSEDDAAEQEIYDSNDEYMGIRYIDEEGVLHIIIDEVMDDKTDFVGYISCAVEILTTKDIEEPKSASIKKDGYFDTKDGKFHFTIKAEIPAYDGKEYKAWGIYDGFNLKDNYDYSNQEYFDLTVLLSVDGKEKEINSVNVAEEKNERIGYLVNNGNIYLVNKCNCSCNNCIYMKKGKECIQHDIGGADNGWCSCWTLSKNSCVSIEYSIKDTEKYILENAGKNYYNKAILFEQFSNTKQEVITTLPIPTLIKKSVIKKDTNTHTAYYSVVVNPDKLDLSCQESVTIKDILKNGTYVPGSIKVVASDRDDKSTTLIEGQDYLVAYKTSSDVSPERNLTLSILQPGACSYTITYEAMIVGLKPGVSESVPVSNEAILELYGNPSSKCSFTYSFRTGWSYQSLQLTLLKQDSLYDNLLLEGAIFELYTAGGTKLLEKTTDSSGKIIFQTDIPHDVILRKDTVYYLKEIQAPEGYQLDDTEYWFYANPTKDTNLEDKYPSIHWIQTSTSKKATGSVTLTNVAIPVLPETGGYDVAGRLLRFFKCIF